jgi:hypothetical protein
MEVVVDGFVHKVHIYIEYYYYYYTTVYVHASELGVPILTTGEKPSTLWLCVFIGGIFLPLTSDFTVLQGRHTCLHSVRPGKTFQLLPWPNIPVSTRLPPLPPLASFNMQINHSFYAFP